MDGRCDICGRFAGSKVKGLYDLWQPDYWNGPRVTFYCPKCLRKEEAKRAKY
jgi:hypothetical protein